MTVWDQIVSRLRAHWKAPQCYVCRKEVDRFSLITAEERGRNPWGFPTLYVLAECHGHAESVEVTLEMLGIAHYDILNLKQRALADKIAAALLAVQTGGVAFVPKQPPLENPNAPQTVPEARHGYPRIGGPAGNSSAAVQARDPGRLPD